MENTREIILPYGKGAVAFTPFADINWQVLEKTGAAKCPPEQDVIRSGIAQLINLLSAQCRQQDSLLIIIPDHTRKCRLPQVLPLLTEKIQTELGITPEFLIANGSHVLQPQAVIEELVGVEFFHRNNVTQHDAKDNGSLVELGVTSAGTQIKLNKKVIDADHVVTLNGVLYHYFAGFGGGPKMLLPGVAGYETIRQNHSRTVDPASGSFHNECFEGNMDTNPVYRDLVQVLDYFPNMLSLQFALDTQGKIAAAQAGDVLTSQAEIIGHVKELYSLPVTKKADMVVASAGGFPADVNLVQTHKAIHHAYQLVKPGGVLIMLAECKEGVGSSTFMPYFDYGDSQGIGARLLRDYQINGHTALSLKAKAEKINILFVSSMDSLQIAKTGMIPVQSINEAIELTKGLKVVGTNGYIFPQANLLVPTVI